jgi:CheY-like chemotaxis protein
VDTGKNGEVMLRLFPTAKYDLIIYDLGLTDINGLGVLRYLKRVSSAVKVIVLSSHPSNEQRTEAEKAGAFLYLEKPIDYLTLRKAIEVAFGLPRSEANTEESHAETTPTGPKITDLENFARSEEIDNTLRRARRFALASPLRPPRITPFKLFFGLAEGGRVEVDYVRTPQFLWKELSARGEDVYLRALQQQFPGLVHSGEHQGRVIDTIAAEVELVTSEVIDVFKLAEEFAGRTVRVIPSFPETEEFVSFRHVPPEIGARHLLAALLIRKTFVLQTPSTMWLTVFGFKDSEAAAFQKRFYDFVVKSRPEDDHEAWRRILIEEAEPKTADTQPTVAGFMADDWSGDDLLNITGDVNALASLVAAYSVEPPLSIGLFGDWGSGKSHFMRQMKKRVETLSRQARESGLLQRDLGYYKNIVQIEFNAWHYIEGNLWASLVDHIFANLKLSDKELPQYAEERRNKLIQELGIKEDLKKKVDSQVEACEQELRKVEERKEQAQSDLNNASTQLEDFRQQAKASLETLTVAVKITAEEKELLNRLGIHAGESINGAEVRKNYDELKGRWNRIKAQWLLFRSDKRVGRRYLLSGLTVLFVVGGPLLLKFGTVPRVPTAVLSILGFVTTFIVAAKPAWEQFQKTLKALEKRDQEVERERLKRISELESKVNALGSEVVAAKLKSDTVGKEIEQLRADIDATSSSRILAEFIEDRAAASDYRRHLGLLALIRRDFEKLRSLFEQQRKEEEAGTEATDDRIKINRIVLYIDDLDRCPPERVVQVLQAIHLLLAFPLFVVVVGVDSRWITRSLQQSYEWLRETDELIGNNGDKLPENGITATGGATPHDYLEKIFQIPFWLRSMNEDACVEFLDGLTKDTSLRVQTESASEPPASKAKTIEPVSNNRVVELVNDSGSSVEVVHRENEGEGLKPDKKPDMRPDRKPDLAPRSLTFTDKEIEYMKTLVPLIGRSPRAVKRFLNCYRLIKVGLEPEEFEDFVGEQGESPSYKAAMILLGIVTGAPTASSYVIEELKKWKPENRAAAGIEYITSVLNNDTDLQQQPDAERLYSFLKSHDFGKPSDQLFKELLNFGPRCSRFSFKLSRAEAAKR